MKETTSMLHDLHLYIKGGIEIARLHYAQTRFPGHTVTSVKSWLEMHWLSTKYLIPPTLTAIEFLDFCVELSLSTPVWSEEIKKEKRVSWHQKKEANQWQICNSSTYHRLVKGQTILAYQLCRLHNIQFPLVPVPTSQVASAEKSHQVVRVPRENPSIWCPCKQHRKHQ
jgi:hypothetical protein